jgi:hypothetical protein
VKFKSVRLPIIEVLWLYKKEDFGDAIGPMGCSITIQLLKGLFWANSFVFVGIKLNLHIILDAISQNPVLDRKGHIW